MPPDHRSPDGERFSVVIVGGGITGLAAAWYLEQGARQAGTDLSVVIVERERVLGGKISTLSEDGFIVEGGPDGFLTRKPWALELARELGIEDDIVYMQASGASLLRNGKLHRIPPGLMGPAPAGWRDVWNASFLSWRGKLRAILEPLVRKRTAARRESLGGFLRRRVGAELTDTLLEALTAGVYGGDLYDMSIDALFPMLEEWEQRYGSIMRGMREARRAAKGTAQPPSAFFSFRGGTQQLVQAVVERLEWTEMIGGRVVVTVDRVEGESQPYRVTLDDERSFEADSVVLATPARDAGDLIGSFAPGLAQALGRMRVSPAVSVFLAFRREDVAHPLDGSGFLAPRSEGGPVAGCTWASSKWPGRSPDGYVLLRAFVRAEDEASLAYGDAELADSACEALRPLLGLSGAPKRTWVHRWADGLPQYRVEHTQWLAGLDRELSMHAGLFLCGASYGGVGVPDCIRQGREAADRVHALALRGAGQGTAQATSA
ncbi:MAG: protoporphyrinogen oxidase [Chloroflexota bacterium]|nr:protoporphyrinogen oxidase [Chloroflexota bacterium]MDE2884063.1 protoporphyrinogen oxidase [Chloroflexota bacterium]